MSEKVDRDVSLPDGSSCKVDEHQYEAIAELKQAISNVALGATLNLTIVQNDGRTITRCRRFYRRPPDGLTDVADALYHECKVARQVAASWDGNVSGEARSWMEH